VVTRTTKLRHLQTIQHNGVRTLHRDPVPNSARGALRSILCIAAVVEGEGGIGAGTRCLAALNQPRLLVVDFDGVIVRLQSTLAALCGNDANVSKCVGGPRWPKAATSGIIIPDELVGEVLEPAFQALVWVLGFGCAGLRARIHAYAHGISHARSYMIASLRGC
jgi:hypothetical protein